MNDLRSAVLQVPSAQDPVLAEIVRRLVEAYHPERIYLFGSAARGEAGEDSDYDIMVVVQDQSEPERRDCDLAYRVLRGLRVAKDLLVWTRNEFEQRLHLKASLPSTIVREGKLLYDPGFAARRDSSCGQPTGRGRRAVSQPASCRESAQSFPHLA